MTWAGVRNRMPRVTQPVQTPRHLGVAVVWLLRTTFDG